MVKIDRDTGLEPAVHQRASVNRIKELPAKLLCEPLSCHLPYFYHPMFMDFSNILVSFSVVTIAYSQYLQ